jgi:hypothetical protein
MIRAPIIGRKTVTPTEAKKFVNLARKTPHFFVSWLEVTHTHTHTHMYDINPITSSQYIVTILSSYSRPTKPKQSKEWQRRLHLIQQQLLIILLDL